MKISIIGPSGSGKTYLARLLSEKYKVLHLNLDEVLFVRLSDQKKVAVAKNEYLKKLESVFQKRDWIIEGLQPIKEVFDEAEIIVWLRPPFYVSLCQQWKRYFNDEKQRRDYGFVNNLRLSRYVLRQYFEKPTPTADPKKTWIKSVSGELKNYKSKLIVIRTDSEKENLIASIKV